MAALVDVILPVFMLAGLGYVAARLGWIGEAGIDGLSRFAQNFAIPGLLFSAIARLDLAAGFGLPLLTSFYAGAFVGFALGFAGARLIFGRSVEDSIAIGFCALFSNSVLLGLPITERAYGTGALTGNYAIISLHAPIMYGFGIVAMELARSAGSGTASRPGRQMLRALVGNPLLIAILAGFVVNIWQIRLPGVLDAAIGMIVAAAIPTALFSLGGVLSRYRPEGDIRVVAWVAGISLVVHPAVTYGLATGLFGLDRAGLRSAVLTAAMAPGVNTYLFATMYGAARRVAASSVLIATALSIPTIWLWLAVLP